MRGVLHRGHWGRHGIIRGVCHSVELCQCAGHTPKLWCLLYPSAHWPLHKPCWTISPLQPFHQLWKREQSQGRPRRSDIIKHRDPALLDCGCAHGRWTKQPEAGLQESGKAEHKSVSWGCKTCLAARSPGLLIFLMLVTGGGKNVKQNFSTCPNLCDAFLKLSPHMSKYQRCSPCSAWA